MSWYRVRVERRQPQVQSQKQLTNDDVPFDQLHRRLR
jgi:hypothetical protein